LPHQLNSSPSIPSPSLCFYLSFFTKMMFFLEFSQSYQGVRFKLQKKKNKDV
jgi:hypothetical protein